MKRWANPPNEPTPMCTGKEPFTSAQLASVVARRIAKRAKCAMSTYKCSVCGLFHVGQKQNGTKFYAG